LEEEGTMTPQRRRFIQAAGAAAGASALGFPSILRAQSEPIRLGLLTIKTGALASGGIDMERGLTIFLKEKNYTMGGRKVVLTVADSGGVPAQARTKMQELVERERVQAVVGPLAAFEALAMDDPNASVAGTGEVLLLLSPRLMFSDTMLSVALLEVQKLMP